MGRATTTEIRQSIVKNREKGKTISEVAAFLGISESTVKSIFKKYKETGSIETETYKCGRKSVINAKQEEEIIATIQNTPDITLLELIEKLDLNISESGLWYWLDRKDYSFKKRHIQKSKIVKEYKINEKHLSKH